MPGRKAVENTNVKPPKNNKPKIVKAPKPPKVYTAKDRIPIAEELTPERAEAVILGAKLGIPVSKACKLAGIKKNIFNLWMEKGKHSKKGKYKELFLSLERAEVEHEAVLLQRMHAAAKGGIKLVETKVSKDKDGNITGTIETIRHTPPDWKAASWLLERIYPESYGKKDELSVIPKPLPLDPDRI